MVGAALVWVVAMATSTTLAAQPAQAPRAARVRPAATGGLPKLRLQLREAQAQVRGSGTFWQWSVLGVGAGLAVAGSAKGVSESVGCGQDCAARPATGALIIAGLALATGGYLWLRLRHAEQARLRSRVYQLRWQLQLHTAEGTRARDQPAHHELARVRFRF